MRRAADAERLARAATPSTRRQRSTAHATSAFSASGASTGNASSGACSISIATSEFRSSSSPPHRAETSGSDDRRSATNSTVTDPNGGAERRRLAFGPARCGLPGSEYRRWCSARSRTMACVAGDGGCRRSTCATRRGCSNPSVPRLVAATYTSRRGAEIPRGRRDLSAARAPIFAAVPGARRLEKGPNGCPLGQKTSGANETRRADGRRGGVASADKTRRGGGDDDPGPRSFSSTRISKHGSETDRARGGAVVAFFGGGDGSVRFDRKVATSGDVWSSWCARTATRNDDAAAASPRFAAGVTGGTSAPGNSAASASASNRSSSPDRATSGPPAVRRSTTVAAVGPVLTKTGGVGGVVGVVGVEGLVGVDGDAARAAGAWSSGDGGTSGARQFATVLPRPAIGFAPTQPAGRSGACPCPRGPVWEERSGRGCPGRLSGAARVAARLYGLPDVFCGGERREAATSAGRFNVARHAMAGKKA